MLPVAVSAGQLVGMPQHSALRHNFVPHSAAMTVSNSLQQHISVLLVAVTWQLFSTLLLQLCAGYIAT